MSSPGSVPSLGKRLVVVIDVAEGDQAVLAHVQALAHDFAGLLSSVSPRTTARVTEARRPQDAPVAVGGPRGARSPSHDLQTPASDRVLQVNLAQREVRAGGQVVSLAHKEFQVLALLAVKSSRVVSREELMTVLWKNSAEEPSPRTVDVYVQRIRAKLGVHRRAITTIRGAGYRFQTGPTVKLVGIDQLLEVATADAGELLRDGS